MRVWGIEKLSNLLKVTQPVKGLNLDPGTPKFEVLAATLQLAQERSFEGMSL